MAISNEREYVLVSVKWSKSFLVYWGTETKEDENRSYSGYTMDLDTCEKYTKEELEQRKHLFWNGESFWKLDKTESYAVEIKNLERFGRKMTVVYL